MITPELIEQLRRLLPEAVSIDPVDLKLHSGNTFYISSSPPDVICYPKTVDDVLKIIDFCIINKIPVIPYGSGTSVEGHTAAIYGGICLDMKKMNTILEVNLEDSYVRVQPGIPYNELNAALATYGFHFPVEAGWGASIGGMVATNASGAGATDAGAMSKNVRSCEVVVYKHGKAAKVTTGTTSTKSSAGYNLTNLFVGSEGTLGVITEITLQIRKNFPVHHTICCQFNEISQAINFVTSMKGIVQFRRAELMDKLQTEACLKFSGVPGLEKDKHTIIVEIAGNIGSVEEQIALLHTYLLTHEAINITTFESMHAAANIWMMRKNACLAAIQLIDSSKKAMATDISVPTSKLFNCILACYEHMQTLKLRAPLVAHVGDGNFHFTLIIDPSNSEELRLATEFNTRIVGEALKFGGTCTGEHGIGLGKIAHLHKQHADTIFLMEGIKCILDPENIFNPGKIVPLKKKFFFEPKHPDGFFSIAHGRPKL